MGLKEQELLHTMIAMNAEEALLNEIFTQVDKFKSKKEFKTWLITKRFEESQTKYLEASQELTKLQEEKLYKIDQELLERNN